MKSLLWTSKFAVLSLLALVGASQLALKALTTGPQVSGGYLTTCGLKTDGTVTCWGGDPYGQTEIPIGLGSVSQVSVGMYHTCVLKTDGTVACWGDNPFGAASVPVGLSSVSQVTTSEKYTCALKTDGTVVCWGDSQDTGSIVPAGLNSVTQISSFYQHTCGVKTDETVACWGNDYLGQSTVPLGLNAVWKVTAGVYHSCALRTDGTVVCWGDSTPPAGLGQVSQLTSGHSHTCALKTDGTVVCWGDESNGASVPAGLNSVSYISAGYLHTCAVKTDGTVVCWGNDDWGNVSSVPAGLNLITGPSPGATPVGNDVAVVPLDQATNAPSPVSLQFDQVVTSGQTIVTTSATGPPPPAGFKLTSPPVYYEISTTATFSGSVRVCLSWSEGQIANENHVLLFHNEGGLWVDVTDLPSRNTTTNTVCGITTSLSPFTLFEVKYAFVGFYAPVDNGSTINAVKAGAAVPVKFSLGGDQSLSIFAFGYPRAQLMQCATGEVIDVIEETVAAGASGLSYDPTTGRYAYVWKTERSWVNSCRQLQVKLADGEVYTSSFTFR